MAKILAERSVRRRPSREWVIAVGIAAVIFCMLSFFGFRWFEQFVTFHPVQYRPGDVVTPAMAQDVWLTSKDGIRLHGWFFKSQQPPTATIIFFHGNGGNITNVSWVGESLSGKGFDVLLIDYRGYGQSEGKTGDEKGIYADADAAYDFVLNRGVSAENIVLYGQSLGTTAAIDVASRRQSGALIVESGLSSASDMASSVLPWLPRQLHFVIKNRFDSVSKIRNVRCPVLIVHGDPDHTIPADQGRALFAAANEPRKLLVLPGAGHNVFGSSGEPYLKLLTDFINNAVSVDASGQLR